MDRVALGHGSILSGGTVGEQRRGARKGGARHGGREGGERGGGGGVAGLTGGGPSIVGISGAMRARDVSRPRAEDEERAERSVVIRRRPEPEPASRAEPVVEQLDDRPGAS
jgi:hypothetical protein